MESGWERGRGAGDGPNGGSVGIVLNKFNPESSIIEQINDRVQSLQVLTNRRVSHWERSWKNTRSALAFMESLTAVESHIGETL
jgi:hypothetical protein